MNKYRIILESDLFERGLLFVLIKVVHIVLFTSCSIRRVIGQQSGSLLLTFIK